MTSRSALDRKFNFTDPEEDVVQALKETLGLITEKQSEYKNASLNIQHLSKDLASEKARRKYQVDQLSADIAQLKTDLQRRNGDFQTLLNKNDSLTNQIQHTQQFEFTTNEVDKLKAQLSESKKLHSLDVSKMSELSTELQKVRSHLHNAEDTLIQRTEECSSAKETICALTQTNEELVNKVAELSETNGIVSTSCDRLNDQLQHMVSLFEEQSTAYNTLESAHSHTVVEMENFRQTNDALSAEHNTLQKTYSDLKDVYEGVIEKSNAMSERVQQLNSVKHEFDNIRNNEEHLEENNRRLQAELDARTNELHSCQERLMEVENTLESQHDESSKRNHQVTELSKYLDATLQKFNTLNSEHSDLQSKLADMEEIYTTEKEKCTHLYESTNLLTEQNSSLMESVKTKEKTLHRSRLEVKDYQQTCEMLQTQLKAKTEEYNSIYARNEVNQQSTTDLSQNVTDLQKQLDKLQSIQGEMGQLRSLVISKNREIQECHSQITKLQNELQSMIESKENTDKSSDQLTTTMETLNNELSCVRAELVASNQSSDSVKQQLESSQQLCTRLEKDLEATQTQLMKLTDELSNLSKQNGTIQTNFAESRSAEWKLSEQNKALTDEYDSLKFKYEDVCSQLKRVEKKQEEISHQSIEEKSAINQKYNVVRSELKEAQKQQEALSLENIALDAKCNELFEQLKHIQQAHLDTRQENITLTEDNISLKHKYNDISSQLEEIQQQQETTSEQTNKELDDLQTRYNQLDSLHKELLKDHTTTKHKYQQIREENVSQLQLISELQPKLNQLQQDNDESEKIMESTQKDWQQQNESLKQEFDQLSNAHQSLQTEFQRRKSLPNPAILKTHSNVIRGLRQDLDSLKHDLSNKNEAFTRFFSTAANTITQYRNALLSKEKNASQQIQRYKTVTAQLEQKLNHHKSQTDQELNDKMSKIDIMKDQLKRFNCERESLQDKISHLQGTLETTVKKKHAEECVAHMNRIRTAAVVTSVKESSQLSHHDLTETERRAMQLSKQFSRKSPQNVAHNVSRFIMEGGLSRYPDLVDHFTYEPSENARNRFRFGTRFVNVFVWKGELSVQTSANGLTPLTDFVTKHGSIEMRKVASRNLRSFPVNPRKSL